MSISKVVDTTDATLISSNPVMLLSVIIGNSDPPAAGAVVVVEFHNANAASDTLDASNLKAKISVGTQGLTAFSHTFDGIMFPKGLVIKCGTAVPITVEYE